MLRYSGIMCFFLKPSFVLKRKQSIFFFKISVKYVSVYMGKEVIPSVSVFKSDVFRPSVFNYSFGGISLLQFCWWR